MTARVRYIGLVGLGQILAFVTGLVVVRTTGRNDYAAYSATMTAVGAVLMVTNTGTGSILTARLAASDMSLGVRGALLRGAFAVRRSVVLPTFCILGAVLAYILINLHQPLLLIIASVAALGILTSSTLYRSLLTADLEIQRQFVPIAASDTVANGVRLLLVVAAAAIAAQNADDTPLALLLVFAVVASFMQTWVAGRASPFHPLKRAGETEAGDAYRRSIAQTLPWTVLSIAGDQLVNVLLAGAGNAVAIAEIGALTRYALAFNLVNSLLGPIVVARIALVRGGRKAVTRSLAFVVLGGVIICTLFVAGSWLFRSPLLGLLGPNYSSLEIPFLILAFASALQFFNLYVLGSVVHARGWTRGNWIFGPGLVLWIVWATLLAPPTTTTGAAFVVLTLQIPSLLSQAFRITLGLRGTAIESSSAG